MVSKPKSELAFGWSIKLWAMEQTNCLYSCVMKDIRNSNLQFWPKHTEFKWCPCNIFNEMFLMVFTSSTAQSGAFWMILFFYFCEFDVKFQNKVDHNFDLYVSTRHANLCSERTLEVAKSRKNSTQERRVSMTIMLSICFCIKLKYTND